MRWQISKVGCPLYGLKAAVHIVYEMQYSCGGRQFDIGSEVRWRIDLFLIGAAAFPNARWAIFLLQNDQISNGRQVELFTAASGNHYLGVLKRRANAIFHGQKVSHCSELVLAGQILKPFLGGWDETLHAFIDAQELPSH